MRPDVPLRPESTVRPLQIVGLGGSLDGDSSSRAALQVALDGARLAGAHTELLDLRELDLPLYVHGMVPPPGARRLVESMAQAHGLIWSSPLYHGTISGALKNALDWLELLAHRDPPYLTDKVVGLVATAGGVQGLQAINTMEYIVRALRGLTLPLTAPVSHAHQAFDADGEPRDAKVKAQLHRLGHELVRVAARMAPLDGDGVREGDEVRLVVAG
jgi:FMN reductase